MPSKSTEPLDKDNAPVFDKDGCLYSIEALSSRLPLQMELAGSSKSQGHVTVHDIGK
jgi:hypothetical protein